MGVEEWGCGCWVHEHWHFVVLIDEGGVWLLQVQDGFFILHLTRKLMKVMWRILSLKGAKETHKNIFVIIIILLFRYLLVINLGRVINFLSKVENMRINTWIEMDFLNIWSSWLYDWLGHDIYSLVIILSQILTKVFNLSNTIIFTILYNIFALIHVRTLIRW